MKWYNLILMLILGCAGCLFFNCIVSLEKNITPHVVSTNTAFTLGENLEYKVHYGLLNAARISLSVDNEMNLIDGKPTWRVIGEGKTLSGYDWFFKVRDYYEAFMSADSLTPVKYIRKVNEGGYSDYEVARFDRNRGKVYSSKGTYTFDEYNFHDILSAIYNLRNMNFNKLKKGDQFIIQFYLDKNLYQSVITYSGRDVISTPVGKYKALILKPKVIVDRVFPNEDAMSIWVSDDLNHIPLKVKSELLIGSLSAEIIKINGFRNPLISRIVEKD